jgi:hypothetical protein
VSWALTVCPVLDAVYGAPRCATEPFAVGERSAPAVAEPSIEFEVPADMDVGVDELAVMGVVCVNGLAELAPDPLGSECHGGEVRPVVFTVGLALDEEGIQSNRNPALESAPFWLDDEVWPKLEEPADCETLPRVVAASRHTLGLELDDADREWLRVEYDFEESREAVTLAHFATGGELERAYSVVEGSVGNRVELGWRAPESDSTSVVRFYTVARDGRGGVSWATHAVCVVASDTTEGTQ